MPVFFQRIVLLGLVGAVLCRPADAQEEYRIDPARSEFVVQLFKTGIGSALAHDHVVRATAYSGRIHSAVSEPSAVTITVEVQAASLQADEPDVRRKYGLTAVLSEQERQEIQTTMASPQQLAIAQYPTLLFRSTQVEKHPEEGYRVTGELTIRGVTRAVRFPVRIECRDGSIHAWGAIRFQQSSFGYEPYSALFGAVRNQDEALLHFDMIALPSSCGSTP
ncbi:MAG: YceI family protein [Deltaproteobacteria bacterium]|nr:YceI family protein [Deltaproteobacteria bacterium]